MEHAIYCKGIKKVYGEGPTKVDALRGIDLELHPGELLMIVGPSGSGKTTLISILSGILYPTEGECIILGQKLHEMENSILTHFRGKHIGFVFQALNLIPMLSAAENVAVPLILNGEEKDQAILQANELLGRYGLSEDERHRFPRDLCENLFHGNRCRRSGSARSLSFLTTSFSHMAVTE